VAVATERLLGVAGGAFRRLAVHRGVDGRLRLPAPPWVPEDPCQPLL
jgi:hypothetical protein